MVKVMHHLIFHRKHDLNAENLTSPQPFPPFFSSSQHFRGSDVVMSLVKKKQQNTCVRIDLSASHIYMQTPTQEDWK